jgi:hypothetical protein
MVVVTKVMCCERLFQAISSCIRFEVYTAVTMKNAVNWDVTPFGSRKNRCFGGTYPHDQG